MVATLNTKLVLLSQLSGWGNLESSNQKVIVDIMKAVRSLEMKNVSLEESEKRAMSYELAVV